MFAPKGAFWDLVGAEVERLEIVDKLVSLRSEAERAGAPVLYAWIRLTEEDHSKITPRNALQQLMIERKMGLPDGGGRFHPRLEPGPDTIVLEPRKGPSPANTDLYKQLRQRDIETVVIAGMVANLCVEAHVREGVEAGFNVVVVSDAIGTTDDKTLESTLANFGLLASGVSSTRDVVESLRAQG